MDLEKILNVLFIYLFIFNNSNYKRVSDAQRCNRKMKKKKEEETEDRPRILCYANFTMNNDFQKMKSKKKIKK